MDSMEPRISWKYFNISGFIDLCFGFIDGLDEVWIPQAFHTVPDTKLPDNLLVMFNQLMHSNTK
jgi:hypothetical protein